MREPIELYGGFGVLLGSHEYEPGTYVYTQHGEISIAYFEFDLELVSPRRRAYYQEHAENIGIWFYIDYNAQHDQKAVNVIRTIPFVKRMRVDMHKPIPRGEEEEPVPETWSEEIELAKKALKEEKAGYGKRSRKEKEAAYRREHGSDDDDEKQSGFYREEAYSEEEPESDITKLISEETRRALPARSGEKRIERELARRKLYEKWIVHPGCIRNVITTTIEMELMPVVYGDETVKLLNDVLAEIDRDEHGECNRMVIYSLATALRMLFPDENISALERSRFYTISLERLRARYEYWVFRHPQDESDFTNAYAVVMAYRAMTEQQKYGKPWHMPLDSDQGILYMAAQHIYRMLEDGSVQRQRGMYGYEHIRKLLLSRPL